MPRQSKQEAKPAKAKKRAKEQPDIVEEQQVQLQKKQEAQPKAKRVNDEMTVLDYIKQEYFKNNPDSDENSAGGAFFKADLSDVEYEDQNEYFNIMKKEVEDKRVVILGCLLLFCVQFIGNMVTVALPTISSDLTVKSSCKVYAAPYASSAQTSISPKR